MGESRQDARRRRLEGDSFTLEVDALFGRLRDYCHLADDTLLRYASGRGGCAIIKVSL